MTTSMLGRRSPAAVVTIISLLLLSMTIVPAVGDGCRRRSGDADLEEEASADEDEEDELLAGGLFRC